MLAVPKSSALYWASAPEASGLDVFSIYEIPYYIVYVFMCYKLETSSARARNELATNVFATNESNGER